MKAKYKVVVYGNNYNLYQIYKYKNTYYVYGVLVVKGFVDKDFIGDANSLRRAVELIKTRSGEELNEL